MRSLKFNDFLNFSGDENLLGEHSYKYLTVDEMKSLGDDSMPIDVTHDEKHQKESQMQQVQKHFFLTTPQPLELKHYCTTNHR